MWITCTSCITAWAIHRGLSGLSLYFQISQQSVHTQQISGSIQHPLRDQRKSGKIPSPRSLSLFLSRSLQFLSSCTLSPRFSIKFSHFFLFFLFSPNLHYLTNLHDLLSPNFLQLFRTQNTHTHTFPVTRSGKSNRISSHSASLLASFYFLSLSPPCVVSVFIYF